MTSKVGSNLRNAMQQVKREVVTHRATERGQLALEQIALPSSQPRRYFDEAAMEALTASVKAHGILQPLLVRSLGDDRYELVAGERRFRAARANELKSVPVYIAELTDTQAREAALTENLQREDVNPLEETEALLELLALKLETPQAEIAPLLYTRQNEQKSKATHNVMGKSENDSTHNVMGKIYATIDSVFATTTKMTWASFVANRLPLLKLPEDILTPLRRGELEYTKAALVARIKDDDERGRLLTRVVEEKLSVSQVRTEIVSAQAAPKQVHRSPLEERVRHLPKLVKRAKVLEDVIIREQVDRLISEIESILSSPKGQN